MCPPGNEKDRFPLFRGNYVIPFSTGNQNSRFPPISGSLVEKVLGRSVLGVAGARGSPRERFKHSPRCFHLVGVLNALYAYFHEATAKQWKTAILVSSGKGDDIISSKQWKTVLFVSRWAHEADTSESSGRPTMSIAPSLTFLIGCNGHEWKPRGKCRFPVRGKGGDHTHFPPLLHS
jgi:hypothetical protein